MDVLFTHSEETAMIVTRLVGCCLVVGIAASPHRGLAQSPPPAAKAEAKPDVVDWAPDLKEAMARAEKAAQKKTGNGLVLVVVSNGQCGYCDWMDKNLFDHRPVVEAARRFAFVREKVGGDETGAMHDSAFAKKHKTEFTPTFYVLDGSGDIVDRFWGTLHPPEEFAARLARSEEQHRTFPELEARAKKNPGDLEAAGRYAAALAARGRVADAVALVKKAEGDAGKPKGELAPAYNRIGDTHYQAIPGAMCELNMSFVTYDKRAPEAAGWFRKTVASSKDPALVAYARFGLASCFQAQGKPAEMAAEHDAILAMPDAPEVIRKRTEWTKKYFNKEK
jgi:thioredoxin-related protein